MTQSNSLSILLVRLGGTQVGLPSLAVREIVRAVAIAPLPGAPAIVEGVVNLRGRIVPVVDVRRRLGIPALALSPDQFLVALDLPDRAIAVRVDDVDDVIDVDEGSLETPSSISPVLERLAGVASTASGAVVVYDVNAFLDAAEREALDATGVGH